MKRLLLIVLLASVCANAGALTKEQATEHLSMLLPSPDISQIKLSAMPGIYEVVIDGTTLYMTGDGGFMFVGPLRDLRGQAGPAGQANTGVLTREQAEKRLSKPFPNADISQIKPSAMADVYEIVADNKVLYMTGDGGFMFTGPLFDLRKQLNLTEQTKSQMRLDAINRIGDGNSISYAPAKYDYTVNVFSDVDCPYCQKFHSQIDEVNALGIRVNYVLISLVGPASYRNGVSVWCAKDRRAALNLGKQGKAVEQKKCDNPLAANLQMAELLGVRATPSFLLSNGRLLIGYKQPQELLEEVKKAAAE